MVPLLQSGIGAVPVWGTAPYLTASWNPEVMAAMYENMLEIRAIMGRIKSDLRSWSAGFQRTGERMQKTKSRDPVEEKEEQGEHGQVLALEDPLQKAPSQTSRIWSSHRLVRSSKYLSSPFFTCKPEPTTRKQSSAGDPWAMEQARHNALADRFGGKGMSFYHRGRPPDGCPNLSDDEVHARQLQNQFDGENSNYAQVRGNSFAVPFLDRSVVHVIPLDERDSECHSLNGSARISGVRIGGGINYAAALPNRFGILGLDGGP